MADDRKEIRFEHPNGRVLIMTPSPTDPFAWTSRFEDDGTSVVDAIVDAYVKGNCK